VVRGPNLEMIKALVVRARNEILRVPGAAIPGILAPTIFYLGLNGVFGNLIHLFDAPSYPSFIIAVSMLQGAGFTGAAAGVNLARDIEAGWFDRLAASPAPRWVLLSGNVISASVRALIPATVLFCVGMIIGAHFPGLGGLAIAFVLVMGMAAVAACWGSMLALHYRTQAVAPLMQAGMFIGVLMTPAYVPLDQLQGWLKTVATINPITQVIEGVRQGFVGGVSWGDTWPAVLVLAGLVSLLGALALRELQRLAE
jgi:ABC-type polysaccharide/polyol phosphate export permease